MIGLFSKDPSFGTDRLASGILDFGNGLQASFTCSTQVAPYQRINILGTHGRVEIDIPFNAPSDRPCRVSLYPGIHSDQGRFELLSHKSWIWISVINTPFRERLFP